MTSSAHVTPSGSPKITSVRELARNLQRLARLQSELEVRMRTEKNGLAQKLRQLEAEMETVRVEAGERLERIKLQLQSVTDRMAADQREFDARNESELTWS